VFLEILALEDFLKKSFDKLVYFSSVQGSNNEENKYYNIGETCILIGPEAGLSEEEEKLVKEMTNSEIINLPTNIMRAPTAVSFCLGYILGKSV